MKYTKRGAQGGAQGTCAGASESDSLASELADSPVSESLIRSADDPASALDSGRVRQWNAEHIPTGSTLDTQSRELLAAMYRMAARDGVSRYHRWRGLPFLWDEEWI